MACDDVDDPYAVTEITHDGPIGAFVDPCLHPDEQQILLDGAGLTAADIDNLREGNVDQLPIPCVADDGAALRDDEGPARPPRPQIGAKNGDAFGGLFAMLPSFSVGFRHVVLYKFRPDAGKVLKDGVVRGLSELPSVATDDYGLSLTCGFAIGTDVGERRGNFDAGLVCDFYSPAEYEKFRTHRSCLSLSRSVLNRDRTLVKQRAKVQFHVPPNTSVTVRKGLFRHCVMFRWKKSVRDSTIDTLHEALRDMRKRIGGIVNFTFGDDACGGRDSYDFAVVADFASYDDFMQYSRHPRNRELSMKLLAPMIRERASAQFIL